MAALRKIKWMIFDYVWRNTKGGGYNMNTLEINSSVWKGMKENQECTSGDYFLESIVVSEEENLHYFHIKKINLNYQNRK